MESVLSRCAGPICWRCSMDCWVPSQSSAAAAGNTRPAPTGPLNPRCPTQARGGMVCGGAAPHVGTLACAGRKFVVVRVHGTAAVFKNEKSPGIIARLMWIVLMPPTAAVPFAAGCRSSTVRDQLATRSDVNGPGCAECHDSMRGASRLTPRLWRRACRAV